MSKQSRGGYAFAVKSILRRYRLSAHYKGTSKAGASRYAIFTGPRGSVRQVCEPCTYREAIDVRDDLIARDILELFGRKQ
jgi:hypothetical protein